MTEPNLLAICVFAFIAVFLLLTTLALVMRVLTTVFPQREDDADVALVAALSAAAAAAYPGMRITSIQEIR
jgi:hypothetical protein